MIRGYDVSHHQGPFDHRRAQQEGFDFCIVKATEGRTFRDDVFERNWRELGEIGMPRGAYHFGRPGSNSARVEARFYLDVAQLGDDDIRPILDLEDWGRETLSPGELADWVSEWVDEVRGATRKRAIVYTRQFWMQNLGDLRDDFDTDLWVPRYSDAMLDPFLPAAWTEYLLWQWAGTSGDEFYPHDVGPVKAKLGPKAQLTVAGRKVDQNVGREGVTLEDLVGKPQVDVVERWVVRATWQADGERHTRDLVAPVELRRLGAAIDDACERIARQRDKGHRIVIRKVVVPKE
ncbi:MAG TPA: glycoside hydrolase family 25 protein [Actinomycetota bacterium]|nr:glycoside hydrolase family 25 protein [Actinomycetota bacterium]